MRQAQGEKLTAYMTRFRKLVARVDPDTELPDSHLIRSFMQGLRSNYGPLIAMQLGNVNALTGLYQVVREIENSIIYEPEHLEKSQRTTGEGGSLEKEIEELASQMRTMSLNYAELASNMVNKNKSNKGERRGQNQTRN